MIDKIMLLLSKNTNIHSCNNDTYQFLKSLLIDLISKSSLKNKINAFFQSNYFGKINFPFYSFGNINSLHLFGIDEIILFIFYYHNQNKYKKVADIGANIGLHSIVMSKVGWNVSSFEPDPVHIKKLKSNLKKNQISNVTIFEKAVSDFSGTTTFTRIKNNTTGSYIAGAKENSYGKLENITVNVQSIKELICKYDFIKMDVEGAEAKIISSTTKKDWAKTDMVCEVGSANNAKIIFNHLRKIGVNAFSQKTNWSLVKNLKSIPKNHTEGSLFISSKKAMNWKMI